MKFVVAFSLFWFLSSLDLFSPPVEGLLWWWEGHNITKRDIGERLSERKADTITVTIVVFEDGSVLIIISQDRKRCVSCKRDSCTFTQLDRNGDGVITLKEIHEKLKQFHVALKINKAFQLVDTNGDGKLTKGEFARSRFIFPNC
ncbi:uncharacterized protein LOC134249303 [Saccostrea cucullata]|uniref:uncharacterized protein LOC134249303 n=1 Tax=Saccostrea cuccullata TaxID=36930 RepID=UPI002ED2180F